MAGTPGVKPRSDEELLTIEWRFLSIRARRKRILIEANYSCGRCGFNERRSDGHPIVEIDHIDGDNQNNSRDNLRVLCPNCHALTPNFRAYGRTNKNRTSTVPLRPGNKEYSRVEELLHRELAKFVVEKSESGEIDFARPGWTLALQRLLQPLYADYPISSQVIARFMKKHMQSFYDSHCYHTKVKVKS
jgi:hypothetical protein